MSDNVKRYSWDDVEDEEGCTSSDTFVLASDYDALKQQLYRLCGCIICKCENEEKCQGCGARNCGIHDKIIREQSALKQQLEAAERMAQEHGWPGYSQGGNPVSYLYNELSDAKQQLDEALGALGYPVSGNTPTGRYKCGLCDAKIQQLEQERHQSAVYQEALGKECHARSVAEGKLEQAQGELRRYKLADGRNADALDDARREWKHRAEHAEARVKWLEEGKRIIELARDGVVFRQASIDEWLAAEPTGREEGR